MSKIKLIYETEYPDGNKKYSSVEDSDWDVDTYKLKRLLKALLITAGFHEESIKEIIAKEEGVEE